MTGPWIRVVSPAALVRGLLEDQLIDLLVSMGKCGRNNYSPSYIRAAFAEAERRGISTPDEAAAGVKLVLRIPVKTPTAHPSNH